MLKSAHSTLKQYDGYKPLRIVKFTTYRAPKSCALLDISMPVVSGLDVLAELRRDARFDHLKILAYTAYAQAEDVSRLVGLGFDDVLVKPLTSAKLLDILKIN